MTGTETRNEPVFEGPITAAKPVSESSEDAAEMKATPFSAEGKEPLTLVWENLTFVIGHGEKKKEALAAVSGSAKPGDMVGIMGPSGAGKSTLLNVLASRAPYGKASGYVSMNGQKPKNLRKKIAYVMQEDALFPTQTPRETFTFTAALKLPELSEAERTELVESVLTVLGLQTCADTIIGSLMLKGISGGEKKRTAIGVELISSPSLIFLDEPTSGLDSHSAFEVIRNLRALANSGSTIVCTIHQPSSEVFEQFTKVMLLRDGACLYEGSREGMLPRFADIDLHCKPNFNPADFAMHQLQTMPDEKIAQLEEAARVAGSGKHEDDDDDYDTMQPVLKSSFVQQLFYLTKRETMQFIRDKPTLGARYGMSVILAVFTGIFFFSTGNEWGEDGNPEDIQSSINNHWGALVFLAINSMFSTAQPMLLVFPVERPVFMREYATGTYGTVPYFLSKTVVEIPAAFLQTLAQFVVCYFMVDMQGNFLFLVLSMVILGLVTSSIALVLSATTTRAETAVNIMPAIYVPQILASGFFISSQSMPVGIRWTQWVCPLKYGLSLSTLSELASKYVPEDRQEETLYILEESDIYSDDWYIYVLVLLAFFFVFRILSAIILARRAKSFS